MNIFNKKSILILFAITLLICSSYADDHIPEPELRDSKAFSQIAQRLRYLAKTKVPYDKINKYKVKIGIKTFKAGYEIAGFACVKSCNAAPNPPCSKPYCIYGYVKSLGKRYCRKTCTKPVENCTYILAGPGRGTYTCAK
ncbi:hypothetical protein HanPI659440_Chr07g0259581 [Helianthus annuus]|nr:hypothetical protein HanLR1_Chr07g0238551 [Helianthus annuus]KAJ0770607.1 hypothetical protein HanPI659440_Chr07g0259581 [Helianthus annuus]